MLGFFLTHLEANNFLKAHGSGLVSVLIPARVLETSEERTEKHTGFKVTVFGHQTDKAPNKILAQSE